MAYGNRRYGPLTASDTLWSIANKVKPSARVSVYQTIIALYDNNPGSFEGGNINRLRPGAYLKLPSESDAAAMSNAAAVERFNALSRGKDTRKVVAVASKEEKAATQAQQKAARRQAQAAAQPTVTPAKAQAKAEKPAVPAPKVADKPAAKEALTPAVALKGEALNQQLQELQAALQTEREEIARLRTALSGKDKELALLRQQIGRDEALQQQVADLMRAKVELDELRGMHQGQLSGLPWYQPLLQSTTLLSLFLGIPTVLLLLLLWALFIRRAGEEPSAYAATSFNDDASLREEVASFDGEALEVPKPGAPLDLAAEVDAALSLDDLDDLLVPSKPTAAAHSALVAEDKGLDLGGVGGRIDLSERSDELPDLDALLGGSSKPAAAKAAPQPASDEILGLDDIDSLLAGFESDKKPGKAEPEPAKPVQEPSPRSSDELLSADDLAAALADLEDEEPATAAPVAAEALDDIDALLAASKAAEAAAPADEDALDDIDALLAASKAVEAAAPADEDALDDINALLAASKATEAAVPADEDALDDIDALLATSKAPEAAASADEDALDDIDALLAASKAPEAAVPADEDALDDIDALLAASKAVEAAAPADEDALDDIDALLAASKAVEAAAPADEDALDDIDALLAASKAVEAAAPADEDALDDIDALLAASKAVEAAAPADEDALDDIDALLAASKAVETAAPADEDALDDIDALLAASKATEAAVPADEHDAEETIELDFEEESERDFAQLLAAADAELEEERQPAVTEEAVAAAAQDSSGTELASAALPDLLDEQEEQDAVEASDAQGVSDDARQAEALELDLGDIQGLTADQLLRKLDEAEAEAGLTPTDAVLTQTEAAPAIAASDFDLAEFGEFTEDDAAAVVADEPVVAAAPEQAPTAAAAEAAEAFELLDLDNLGSFTEEDAARLNTEAEEFTFDGVTDFSEEALLAAAAQEQAASQQQTALVADDDVGSVDDDQFAAAIDALALNENTPVAAEEEASVVAPPRADADQAIQTEESNETADARTQSLLAELAALGEEEAAPPTTAQAAPAWSLETAEPSDTAAAVEAATAPVAAAAEEGEIAPLEAEEVLLPVAPIPVEAFPAEIENTLAMLDSVRKQPAPLFQADHSDHDRLGDALPAGFHGQSKIKSAFHGFEEILPEVNHIDVDDDNGCSAKLDLARAYIDIDDPEGAREILDEVMNDGNTDQRIEAQRLLMLMQRAH